MIQNAAPDLVISEIKAMVVAGTDAYGGRRAGGCCQKRSACAAT